METPTVFTIFARTYDKEPRPIDVNASDTVSVIVRKAGEVFGVDPSVLSVHFENEELEKQTPVVDTLLTEGSEVVVKSKKIEAKLALKDMGLAGVLSLGQLLRIDHGKTDAELAVAMQLIIDASQMGVSDWYDHAIDTMGEAANKGLLEVVKMLVGYTANYKEHTDLEKAWIGASGSGKDEVLEYLIADTAVDMSLRNSCLGLAASFGHVSTARILIKNGALVNNPHAISLTPLSQAVSGQYPEMVEYLLSEGADPNAAVYGSTPLHNAVKLNCYEVVKLLLSHGADATLKNRQGETAYELARDSDIAKLVKIA